MVVRNQQGSALQGGRSEAPLCGTIGGGYIGLMSKSIASPEQLAVQRGYWTVSLPVWLLLMGFMWPPILYFGVDAAFNTSRGLCAIGLGLLLGIIAGWAWWSVTAPRWRLWAYQRVTDLHLLEQLAVADKLVWPIDHVFTRTELRRGLLRERLMAYEASMHHVRCPPQADAH